jgi:hypothetical protein
VSSTPPNSTPPSSSTPAQQHSDLGLDSPEDVEALVALVGVATIGACFVASSPVWGPAALLGDHYDTTAFFPAYPYAVDGLGYPRIAPGRGGLGKEQEAHFGDPDYLRTWSVRLALEDGNDFRGLNRLNGRLVVDTSSRFGVQSNWDYFSERLGGGRSDETLLGDTNLTFRFAQTERVQMYAGLGFRTQADRSDTRFGFNFLYGGDVFLGEPLVLSASLDVGNLSSDLVVHGRGTVGLIYKRWEAFGGYDFLRIGSVNLQGPMLGFRVWF